MIVSNYTLDVIIPLMWSDAIRLHVKEMWSQTVDSVSLGVPLPLAYPEICIHEGRILRRVTEGGRRKGGDRVYFGTPHSYHICPGVQTGGVMCMPAPHTLLDTPLSFLLGYCPSSVCFPHVRNSSPAPTSAVSQDGLHVAWKVRDTISCKELNKRHIHLPIIN